MTGIPPLPSAYETGSVEFFYRPFRTDRRALIPRFETESLVREVVTIQKKEGYSVLVDVGTGTGVIAVSVGLEGAFERVIALDLSDEALSLAQENALRNGLEVTFRKSDLLSGLEEALSESGTKPPFSILFVANLPYVRDGDTDVSPDTVHEPPMALYGGSETGFETTRRFLEAVEAFAREHSDGAFRVACEVGDDHAAPIARFAQDAGRDVRTFADPF